MKAGSLAVMPGLVHHNTMQEENILPALDGQELN